MMCKSITERIIKREQYQNIKTQEPKWKNTNETGEIWQFKTKRMSIREVKRAANKKNKANKIRAQIAFDLPLKTL